VPRQRLGVRRAASAPRGARCSRYVTVREEPKSQQASGAQERVLVVEGSDVIEAADREAALGRAAADVDVVLLDLMLPGASRLEVAQRARADPRTPALPIAFMSTVVDRRRSSED
jgi:CheY-like chemotaxis protein